MKHVIIGTAGHVDHGKTSLIQALTGTNPDRLKEEQERGMTIDIGFASLRLPDGNTVGIVDVPGHERFLKNMLAGASGVDVVLLVIAADEGVMPQTEEHLAILRLLDVRIGVIALTKSDLVDKEWTDIVEEDVRARLKDTFLASAPIMRVSSTTGRGIDALKKALLAAVSRAEARNTALPFRLPIDRVFTRQGFGTVVTGTLVAGSLQIGDAVKVQPQGISARIRGLQMHGEKQTHVEAGSRVAVNLSGIEVAQIDRGAQLAAAESSLACMGFDAALRLLPGDYKLIKDRARVRVHIGTAEVIGRMRILDERTELAPGSRAYVQFRAEESLAALRSDRFVVRTYSPMHTIGGGIVLDTELQRYRKNDPVHLAALEYKERGSPSDLVQTKLDTAPLGISRKSLYQSVNMTQAEGENALNPLIANGSVVLLPGQRIISSLHYRTALDRLTSALEEFHRRYPLRTGMQKEELGAVLGKGVDLQAFGAVLAQAESEGRLATEGAKTRLANFKVTLNERQTTLLSRIEAYYTQCGIATPSMEEVSSHVQAPPDAVIALLKIGADSGRFCFVSDTVYYSKDTVDHVKEEVQQYIAQHGSIGVGELRDQLDSNRKDSMQILEYLDSIRFTVRRGDKRVLV